MAESASPRALPLRPEARLFPEERWPRPRRVPLEASRRSAVLGGSRAVSEGPRGARGGGAEAGGAPGRTGARPGAADPAGLARRCRGNGPRDAQSREAADPVLTAGRPHRSRRRKLGRDW